MNRAEFNRAIKNSTEYTELLDAYTSMVTVNMRAACSELDNPKVIEKSVEHSELGIRLLKVNMGKNMYYNCAIIISKEGYNLEYEDGLIENIGDKTHLVILINGVKYTIYDIIANTSLGEYSYKSKLYSKLEASMVDNMNNLFEEKRVGRIGDNKTNSENVGFEIGKIYNMDCMVGMKQMGDRSIDFVLTDIPYDGVNEKGKEQRINSQALRKIDKGYADELTFKLDEFMDEVTRVTSNSVCIFCGHGQISEIYNYLIANNFSTRIMVWEKTNPSPIAGEHIYLSGIEIAVWGKRKGGNGVFNAFCKNTVLKYPSGTRDINPTQKNVELFKELILDNTNEGDTVFDPCMGSGTTAEASMDTGRKFIGFELNEGCYIDANKRLARIQMPGMY